MANPYSVLDYASFHAELVHQSTLSAESQGKLGAPRQGGLVYYLWSLTLGARLGAGARRARRRAGDLASRRARSAGCSCPAPLLFLAFMGLQGRYFGRWLLPIFPLLCLLAAFFVLQSAEVLARLLGRARGAGPRGEGGEHDAPRHPGAPPRVAQRRLARARRGCSPRVRRCCSQPSCSRRA